MMMRPLEYDKTDPKSIEAYSQRLIGKTFKEVLDDYKEDDDTIQTVKERETAYENDKWKGRLGVLIEQCFFHYKANSKSSADFFEAGVELKVTPYKKNSTGLVAKERLVIMKIDYMKLINETFETSHLKEKAQLMLLIYYLNNKNKLDPDLDPKILSYTIHYSQLFTFPKEDLKIIKEDFEIIFNKVKAGMAHELSGADTLYLEAATKAAKASDRTWQPNNPEKAKPRAFALKSRYMTIVLNTYIVPGKTTYEPILKEDVKVTLETYVVEKISEYQGRSVDELRELFGISLKKDPKNYGALIAYRILGIKGKKATEFEKANIEVKTIRIQKSGKIKENMSFSQFKFTELVKEEWDTSTFGNNLRDTKFFFIVYKEDETGTYRLRGCQFWNMPYADIEGDVRFVWEKTKRVLNEGLVVENINGKTTSNLPKQSENSVCHVRSHAKNKNDTYKLPTGGSHTKQSFWLNNSYILSQLNKELKE